MTEKNAKFISGLTLGAICLILNFGFPIVTLTLGYIADAPMRLANDLASEMFDWAGGLSLGRELLVFIPVLLAVLGVGLVGLVASAFLWILKIAAMTKTLVLVGFLVGYKFQIPPASAVEGIAGTLRNTIRQVAATGRDLFIEIVVIPVSNRFGRPAGESESVILGGLPMKYGKDDPPSREDDELPEVRGDRGALEERKIKKASSSLWAKIKYKQEQKRKKEVLVARRETEQEEILRIQAQTAKVKAVKDYVRGRGELQDLERVLEIENDQREADHQVKMTEAKAAISDANVRIARNEDEVRNLGKTRKGPKLDPVDAKLDALFKNLPRREKRVARLAEYYKKLKVKADAGDIGARHLVAELSRTFDDLMTGDF